MSDGGTWLGKGSKVEVSYLLARPGNVFDQKQLRGYLHLKHLHVSVSASSIIVIFIFCLVTTLVIFPHLIYLHSILTEAEAPFAYTAFPLQSLEDNYSTKQGGKPRKGGRKAGVKVVRV